jgi:hypothetical protein
MPHISASRALYIKLGEGGRWERSSIENGEIRFGFQEIPHEICQRGDWVAARDIEKGYCKTDGALTRAINQVKEFYTADESVMWITFHAGKLWWCFAETAVEGLDNEEKVRKVKGKWQDVDKSAGARFLWKRDISGKLTAVEKYRGTICNVSEFGYLMHKVNGTFEKHVEVAKEAYQALRVALIPIIKNLHEFDFEIFVDLIFRQSGWQRVGVSGGTEKDIDLDLISPATGDRIAVQIKSVADLAVWRDYKTRLSVLSSFSRLYFVTHTPTSALAKQAAAEQDDYFVLWDADELASQAVRGGLTGWLLDKAS